MLSESSYLMAIYVYTGAAGVYLLFLIWWMRRRSAALVALMVLLSAALLLTPAYPKEGVATLAPALIVAGFQLFTEGYEAAQHALKPLAFMCGLAVVLALLLRLTILRPRSRPPAAKKPAAEAGTG